MTANGSLQECNKLSQRSNGCLRITNRFAVVVLEDRETASEQVRKGKVQTDQVQYLKVGDEYSGELAQSLDVHVRGG